MRKPGAIADLLRSEGIRTRADLYRWLKTAPKGADKSNYGTMVHAWGEVNAGRVMRLVEVAEWGLAVTRG